MEGETKGLTSAGGVKVGLGFSGWILEGREIKGTSIEGEILCGSGVGDAFGRDKGGTFLSGDPCLLLEGGVDGRGVIVGLRYVEGADGVGGKFVVP